MPDASRRPSPRSPSEISGGSRDRGGFQVPKDLKAPREILGPWERRGLRELSEVRALAGPQAPQDLQGLKALRVSRDLKVPKALAALAGLAVPAVLKEGTALNARSTAHTPRCASRLDKRGPPLPPAKKRKTY